MLITTRNYPNRAARNNRAVPYFFPLFHEQLCCVAVRSFVF